MWALENETPLAAKRAFVRDRQGAEIWVVAVKGTFAISPGGPCRLAEKQLPVLLAPEYFGEPGRSSLRYDADLVLTKPATDIVLHGSAHAPGGREVREARVGMAVGTVRKELRVLGPGVFDGAGELTPPSHRGTFRHLPLSYEVTHGGADPREPNPLHQLRDPRNPVGRGFAVNRRDLAGAPAPCVCYPEDHPLAFATPPVPAGFGPIPREWSPRRELAGDYRPPWHEERFPLLPADFDERHFLCSPADQRPQGHLRGGEPVTLYNLTPSGRLSFQLPELQITFHTDLGSEEVEHGGLLHTVILEPDLGRVQMVWHTTLPCHSQVYKLRRTRITGMEVVG